MARATLANDGSVSDDPCQECEGRLVLRTAGRGGWFLGCSNFPKGCTFKMAPNPHQMEELAEERAERKQKRAEEKKRKEAEIDRIDREKRAKVKAQRVQFCEECFMALTPMDTLNGREKHQRC